MRTCGALVAVALFVGPVVASERAPETPVSASSKGAVPFYSEDSAKLGQSPEDSAYEDLEETLSPFAIASQQWDWGIRTSLALINDLSSKPDSSADFEDQGEYVGPINMGHLNCTIGLQVVALGDGKFSALAYRGGLPGNGYDFSKPMQLTGSRTGDQVVLTGDSLVVTLQTGYAAVVKNPAGDRLGFLQPIKRVSPTIGLRAPDNAIILFDGRADRLKNAKLTEDGLLEVGAETKEVFRNFTMHAEFRIPYMPKARGQARGNSGFYLQRRYEIQVLDSFGLESQFNDCASIYRQKPPDFNMCFPPMRWQTYDISFQAAKFRGDGFKYCKAHVTVRHNGVVVQNNAEIATKTGAGKPEGPDPMPILFQNHNDKVNFRNIWIVDEDAACSCSPCSVQPCSAQPCQTGFGRRGLSCRH